MHELRYWIDWESFSWLTLCKVYVQVCGRSRYIKCCFQILHSL